MTSTILQINNGFIFIVTVLLLSLYSNSQHSYTVFTSISQYLYIIEVYTELHVTLNTYFM